MSSIENLIKKFCETKKSSVVTSDEMDEKVLNGALAVYEKCKTTESARLQPDIWRIIMKSGITKIAAAAVLIIAVLIGINHFGGSVNVSSVAFGQVLEYFQGSSYSFDLTTATVIKGQDQQPHTNHAMVWEVGKMRFDVSGDGLAGNVSSITDFNAGSCLILFHQTKTGVPIEFAQFNAGFADAGGVFSFCSKPVENLWNLRDGTEEQLGEKEIDGQRVTGFRVFQEDQYFEYDMTIWADIDSGAPVLVEVIAKPLEESYPSMKWRLENFDLDVELDEGLFSLDVPAGYTLAYQENLDGVEVETEASVESEKIVQMLELWSQGDKNGAIELLLEVDWAKKIEFGKEPYIFSLTEKGYISLKHKDQQRAMKNIMAMASTMKKIVMEAIAKGKAAVVNQNYTLAEQYFNAGLQLGKLLDRNPEGMLIARLVGIAFEQKTLTEMISLYKATNDNEKFRAAEKQLRTAEAAKDEIKRKAMGQ